jgi:2-polyprenyl-3-methyl-5-hydroxy-6-metoxy-1,4-benzoquinol methylase
VPQASKRILNLGCGNGANLFQFARRGYEVWGMDVEANTIRPCKELLLQGHFIQGELQETGLPDAHFNSIRIDNVLEHAPDPKEIIRECHPLLRPKEQLPVYVPHGRSLSMRLIKSNSIFSWMLFHFQLFARKVLGAVAGRSRLYRYSSL